MELKKVAIVAGSAIALGGVGFLISRKHHVVKNPKINMAIMIGSGIAIGVGIGLAVDHFIGNTVKTDKDAASKTAKK